MIATIQTIPDILVTTRGNQMEAARLLSANRATIKKYSRDFDGKQHAIVNGVLMVNRGGWGQHKRLIDG
ncbi:protein ninH [Ewingella sp. S1.OA.A_B6]